MYSSLYEERIIFKKTKGSPVKLNLKKHEDESCNFANVKNNF